MLHTLTNKIKEILSQQFSNQEKIHEFDEPPLGRSIYVASAVVNILALALPLTILQVYDRVLPNSAFETLTALIIGLFCVILLDGILKYLRSYIANWSATAFTHKLSVRALSAMLNARPSKFNKTTPSEHLERLNAISGLGGHIGGTSRLVSVDILFIPIFAGVIILVGGTIFLVMLSLFVLFGYLAVRRTNELNNTIEDREKKDSRKFDFIIEILCAMQTVKSHAMEPLIMRRFERLQSSASIVTRRLIELNGNAQIYNAMYASLSVIAIVGLGALIVFSGKLTMGALACCMLLSSQLLQPLMRSLSAWNEIQLAAHRRKRIASIFEEDTDFSAPLDPHSLDHLQAKTSPGEIEFKNVTIQHDPSKILFDGLDLKIPAGQIIAIRGVDGSGRTSLLRSLVGDILPATGTISLNGVDINGTDDASPRLRIRYVAPTPTIFRGSIIDNISLFGELSAASALRAAKLIGLDEEVVRMPLGYDTNLKGASGRDIPGSTAQRICIARAIATNPSVIIFDETNTILDMTAERKFGEALSQIKLNSTIILATHRPSLLRLADIVYDISDRKLTCAALSDPVQNAVRA